MTANPRGQVFAILNGHNLTRGERLAVLSFIATRSVTSLNDLSLAELEHAAGTLFSWDAAGHLGAQLAEILGRRAA